MGVTSVRISKDIEAPLNELAEKLDRSKNYLINQALKDYLARQAMADSRWEDTLVALKSVEDNNLIDSEEVLLRRSLMADYINGKKYESI